MENKHIIEQINNEITNNKLSHAYLIETNKNDEIDQVITEIITLMMKNKDKNYEYNENDLNLYEIKSENNVIKKEQILEMMSVFNTKSLNERPLVYVIYDAEKMNLHSSNTLLKFLEEPENNIIGIIVSPSKELLIDTIVSRCRIYSLNKSNVKNEFKLQKEYIKMVTKNELNSDFFNEVMVSKENALLFFEEFELYFLENLIVNKKLIELIFEYKNKVKFNTNLKLMFKAFDIEFRRYYETK